MIQPDFPILNHGMLLCKHAKGNRYLKFGEVRVNLFLALDGHHFAIQTSGFAVMVA